MYCPSAVQATPHRLPDGSDDVVGNDGEEIEQEGAATSGRMPLSQNLGGIMVEQEREEIPPMNVDSLYDSDIARATRRTQLRRSVSGTTKGSAHGTYDRNDTSRERDVVAARQSRVQHRGSRHAAGLPVYASVNLVRAHRAEQSERPTLTGTTALPSDIVRPAISVNKLAFSRSTHSQFANVR